jgi:two-component system, sensor histidine kinase and response regulator
MKTQKNFLFPGNIKPVGITGFSAYFLKKFSLLITAIKSLTSPSGGRELWTGFIHYYNKVRTFGFTASMDEYEKRKLGIFNQLNLFQLLIGIVLPITVIFNPDKFSVYTRFIVLLPSFISILVLHLNSRFKYDAAMLSYFILYPFLTSLAYLHGMNLGVELFFMLYGILSVFFLHQISHMMFCIGFSMINYFMLAVVLKKYQFYLETANPFFYLLNHLLAIGFIFYGLYLIKKENAGYQAGILNKNNELKMLNVEMQKQKEVIAEKAGQLNDLNSFKNRLFSIISHDLKAPMYALRDVFQDINQYKLTATQIKNIVPDVVKDLNYTTGLMENLLQWAKSQMQADTINPQVIDISVIMTDTKQLLNLQAEAKDIRIETRIKESLIAHADKDMISLVLRNLISNAIKFTPAGGSVSLSAQETPSFIEIIVKDSGTGISREALKKIKENNYYSSKGTANESGTGLGLMLCREFLAKNGSQLHIESKEGSGSTFSFTLPKTH